MTASEFRKDPLSDRWVIIAEERSARPSDYLIPPVTTQRQRCPFCPGHEEDTPPTLVEMNGAGDGWQVRVVPNKFPAVREDYVENGRLNAEPGLFQSQPAAGEHEIIIESPRHVESLTRLEPDELALALRVYRDRMSWHRSQGRWSYAQLFKNVGAFAGASLRHTHSQLVAMPMVPHRIVEELRFAGAHWEQNDGRRCLFCEMLEKEEQAGERMVAMGDRFGVFCPFASRFAYETWILPLPHQSHFSDLANDDLVELASLLIRVLSSVEACCAQTGYNLLFHTAPFAAGQLKHYHWHIEIVPRTTTHAGFEWGSDYWINPVSPEHAARELRKARRGKKN